MRKLLESGVDTNHRSMFNMTIDFTVKDFLWYTSDNVVILNQTTEFGGGDVTSVATLLFAPSEGRSLEWCRQGLFGKCEVWKGGMTALNIAEFVNNEAIVGLLKSRTTAATVIVHTSFAEYLCDFCKLSSIEEAEKALKPRKFTRVLDMVSETDYTICIDEEPDTDMCKCVEEVGLSTKQAPFVSAPNLRGRRKVNDSNESRG